MSEGKQAKIFITCLVDFLFPSVGRAMVKVLRHYGVELEFPSGQTCCGQPAFNAGFQARPGRWPCIFSIYSRTAKRSSVPQDPVSPW